MLVHYLTHAPLSAFLTFVLTTKMALPQEFHEQGTREVKEFGCLISPAAGFDSTADGDSRHGFTLFFLERLAMPLFEKLDVLSRMNDPSCIASGLDLSHVMENIRTNIAQWKRLPHDQA